MGSKMLGTTLTAKAWTNAEIFVSGDNTLISYVTFNIETICIYLKC